MTTWNEANLIIGEFSQLVEKKKKLETKIREKIKGARSINKPLKPKDFDTFAKDNMRKIWINKESQIYTTVIDGFYAINLPKILEKLRNDYSYDKDKHDIYLSPDVVFIRPSNKELQELHEDYCQIVKESKKSFEENKKKFIEEECKDLTDEIEEIKQQMRKIMDDFNDNFSHKEKG